MFDVLNIDHTMVRGWIRRRIYWYFKRDDVERYQKLRRGECTQCGYCCRRSWCVFLDRKTNRCKIYNHRPEICRQYMLTPHDKKDNPNCGFYFITDEEVK